MEHNCEVAETLVQFHRWVHRTMEAAEETGEGERVEAQAEDICERLLAVLNADGPDSTNGVRLLAIYELIATAVENVEASQAARIAAKAVN